MNHLNNFSLLTSETIRRVGEDYGTPVYLYDERLIIDRCMNMLSMPNAYGLSVRYAMKANSTKAILQAIHSEGLKIDASSLNEALRAHMAGIPYEDIMLTTQEVPEGDRRKTLEECILQGMGYNVCSLRQLREIGDFASKNSIHLSIRVHPGVGAGESATRNTGDNYSCFGVHLSDISEATEYATHKGLLFSQVHVHIGSGGDPVKWQENIDRELGILETYFPEATSISFGGGLKEARMPDETAADVKTLGTYAKKQIEAFFERTGRKLHMEVEPGTYIVANAGYIVTKVIDKKRTGDDGLNFLITDGGMEVNTRPLLYGSKHPFYVISNEGVLLSSEFGLSAVKNPYRAAVVGRCCESGDSQTLDEGGLNTPRTLAEPEIGDYLVIGGAGAYGSSMSPFNYNSHVQAPEVMLETTGSLREIRKKQSLRQMVENEL